MMEITMENKEQVKLFARILKSMGVEQTTAEMICIMLQNKNQMDEVVRFIDNNPKATEKEIFNKVTEITEK